MKKLLIVDDERNMRDLLRILFENDGFAVWTASSGAEALGIIDNDCDLDLIISDVRLPDIEGVCILPHLRSLNLEIPVILITAYGTIELAVEAMKQGAADFIAKPFKKEFIRHLAGRVLNEAAQGPRDERQSDSSWGSVVESPIMQALMHKVSLIADTTTSVLLVGESGVGKEVVARAIHRARGAERPFMSISCPAMPPSLIESELFGYGKGAFTGATRAYPGKLSQADGGTLMLDEIGDLPLEVQPKLLRFLEEHSFHPLGENKTVRVQTRLISATNRSLEELVAEGRFREDLYYRINAITLRVPPLRERFEDILPLANRFQEQIAAQYGKAPKRLALTAERALLRHDWPGNVRELRNVMEHAFVFAGHDGITISDLPPKLQELAPPRPRTPGVPAGESAQSSNRCGGGESKLDEAEKALLVAALNRTNWNITAAARELGVSRNVVRYRMRKYGIETERSHQY